MVANKNAPLFDVGTQAPATTRLRGRALLVITSSILVAACARGEVARDPTSMGTAQTLAPQPQYTLSEPGADKLGTAPEGFGLKVGDRAPDAMLPDLSGKTESLAALFSEGPTLLLFYRGGWCPYCNLQLHDYAAAKPEFDRHGVRVVAISVDKPSEEAKRQAKHGISFPMLSDSKLVAHQAYRVVHEPGDAERKGMAAYGIDLAMYSGESHGDFAVPAIFLIDRERIVRFVHVDQDYKTRPSAKQMLAVADRVFGMK